MEKIWLRRYRKGVPAEIDPDAYRSLVVIFEQACREFGARRAFTNLGRTLSFSELEATTGHFAAFLQQGLGQAKGGRIAIMMPNVLQYPIVLFGALRAGLTVTTVNPLYTPPELEHQLNDSGAETIVVLENFGAVLAQVVDNTNIRNVILTRVGDMLSFPRSLLTSLVVKRVKKLVPPYRLAGAISFRSALARGQGLRLQPVEVTGEDLAFLQYTGGTTGLAKGAMLTHRNMVANVQQGSSWLHTIRRGNEVIITALPLYHIFSLTANCLTFMKIGALNVLITNPRDLGAFIAEMRKWKFTAITGVNTLFNGLLHHPEFAKLDFSSLSFTLGGGMAVQEAVAKKWKEVTGVALVEAYGLTEASPAVCMNPMELQEHNGSIGLPIPSTEVSLRDERGKEVPLGNAGELCIRGPQVMRGYWNQTEETRKTLTEDGWLLSGDIAKVDAEGFFRILDRKKDMIIVSGFKVYPNEIENVVAMHPDVMEAACIGVPDEKSGEAVKVFIVVKENIQLSVEDVRQHCRQKLTGYKVPKHIEFRTELPKSNVGKILRRELRG